ncbi:RNA polymerase sigma factor [Amycolatopsis sp. H20-H5]|uniref:RNA polymerase sigma factor n=1 Tax=Amycolatopsis sp. H20-H5 TaxID=3046309 RepID=UPI002DBF8F5D|nr:sigma factor [Amycolatopsis sp. H20-H5]MEC3982013.1 sigma factor [Amycolatopsis sp. H20-H5]
MIGSSSWHQPALPPHADRWEASRVDHTPWVDTVLVARARAGDVAAFESLVLRHLRPVYQLARRTLPAGTAADEVVVEAFVRAWHDLERCGRTAAGFRAWITMVTAQVCRETNPR